MWCSKCEYETSAEVCEFCGDPTETDIPTAVFWCSKCNIPIIRAKFANIQHFCPLCSQDVNYLCADLRPVFPEERLLFEAIKGIPLAYVKDSVWVSNNRYYINGKVTAISNDSYSEIDPEKMIQMLAEYSPLNSDTEFKNNIAAFVKANRHHLDMIVDEAFSFIENTTTNYPNEHIIISFSGGKDSTVTADLVIRALRDARLVHIFGDTTLEHPLTLEYIARYRLHNPHMIFKTATNNEQNFFRVCEDIGPPARMLRWCCYMFKTGPIARVINKMYRDQEVLTFYGIRRYESVARSKYNRVESDSESMKIRQQRVASPIFSWKDIDVWLYILAENIDFNDAYRLGYDRVGCWCCPNNNEKAEFLAKLFLTERYKKWRDFLVNFAKRIGKTDAENYIDSGKWKARQGGNGLAAASDVIIHSVSCTSEEHSTIYQLNKKLDDGFFTLFIPFGRIAPELGRKLISEVIVVDVASNIPILSIQPINHDEYLYAVKVETLNVKDHEIMQRKVAYQIKKYNACRQCLKCESVCKHGAISITYGEYSIDDNKCKRCQMCITSKYIQGGCQMDKYLRTRV